MKKLLALLLLSPLVLAQDTTLDCSASSISFPDMSPTSLDNSSFMTLTINVDKKLVDVFINTWGSAPNIGYEVQGKQMIEFEVTTHTMGNEALINRFSLNRISGELVEKIGVYSVPSRRFVRNISTTYGTCVKKKSLF